ncbi:hypothetical protein M422DRAFT_271559 [Sphaerobolus stellatus SS14]|uniref:Unplaced genomic scaffold SPHSTscaffold_265, whole genome shotgun sequence n=1 Tax=Sphaerobolus stellatus (strain SS14) TaxID=990650 RepID=A0A0C9TZV0_SPHS4|nr:hypothetical protein M422DRAFT_271559 [Sphaerobolus stellatus SS14]
MTSIEEVNTSKEEHIQGQLKNNNSQPHCQNRAPTPTPDLLCPDTEYTWDLASTCVLCPAES